jgi:endonuclease/exonuclease/phosphatase family metal-dependent hydrolase
MLRSTMLRRPRRRVRGAAALLLVASALTATTGATAAPALAATAAPRVHLVAGDRMITARWSRIADAARYVVRYSTTRSMAHARTRTTTATSVRLPGLVDYRTYWITVRPVSLMAAASSRPASAAAHAVPVRGVPLPVTAVSARPGGPNQVVVSWSGGSRLQKVAVIAGADSMTSRAHFSSAWNPAGTTSITLTVPTALRTLIGAGTGNVVFVKVVESNSSSTTKHLLFDLKDRYRLSSSGTYSLAGDAPTTGAAVTHLHVATLNVQSEPATARYSAEHQWANRLPRIVRTIEASHPDLFGAEELDTTRTDSSCLVHVVNGVPRYCSEQYNTLADRLAGAATPYRMASTSANAFIRNEEMTHSGSAVVDSHLFYNPAVLSVVQSGYFSPKYDLHVPWSSSAIGDDRGGSWAEFEIAATGQRFIAAAVHLSVGSGSAITTNRKQEAAALATYLDAKARTDAGVLPIVLVGDFNSYAPSDADAPSTTLMGAGYFDAAATMTRSGWRFGTSNAGNGPAATDPGYPVHAVLHPYPTSRIDYILLKGSRSTFRYTNVTHITNGRFDSEFQGTDHNLQLAEIGIGAPQG